MIAGRCGLRVLVLLVLAAAAVACRGRDLRADGAPAVSGETANDWFVDRAQASGLDFVHVTGASGEFYFPENMSPGAALFDYDNDGDLDVYLAQGRMLGSPSNDPSPVPRASPPLKGRLFRNDLTAGAGGTRRLHFTDVTAQSGIEATHYGMGAAAADIDNDGCIDLYLTNFGPGQLYRNRCDGTFVDMSRQSGTGDDGFSVSAAFVDYDRDGWIDLYVGNYLDYRIATNKVCTRLAGERDYCPPHVYPPQPDRLYRNRHNGTFEDVTANALAAGESGPALGVSTADFNGDGWMDIYVANDNRQNLLWINQRNGTLKNTALAAGAALPSTGKAEASMGVDAGDFDNDGDEDLFVTELTGEGHNLFVNDGTGVFDDRSTESGLGLASLPYTGFGAAWIDYDNDGLLDILTVNGTISAIEALVSARDPLPYRQPRQLFHNTGNGRFEDVSRQAGSAFQLPEMGRGAAFGDVDNDGDTDVVVANAGGPARLLINGIGNQRHWAGLVLQAAQKRNALGARVLVSRADGMRLWRRARADGSYGSANDARVLVGLGESREPVTVRLQWPSGRMEEWKSVAVDRYTNVAEGTGMPVAGWR